MSGARSVITASRSAACVNAILLFLVALYILYEAYQRLSSPPEIESMGMLVVATLGLVINLISMRLLSGGKEESLNVKGAYGSLERYAGFDWRHPVRSSSALPAGAGSIRSLRWPLAYGSCRAPDAFESQPEYPARGRARRHWPEVEKAILEIPGVTCVHDLHVWAITSGKISLTVHAVCTDVPNYPVTLKAIRSMLADRFDIHHATLQLEDHPCEQATELHAFEPHHGKHPGCIDTDPVLACLSNDEHTNTFQKETFMKPTIVLALGTLFLAGCPHLNNKRSDSKKISSNGTDLWRLLRKIGFTRDTDPCRHCVMSANACGRGHAHH